MSTYWGFVCVSHDPPLVSEHWFNHGEDTLTALHRAVRGGQWPISEYGDNAPVDHLGYQTAEPVLWLVQHPRCQVALHNEYDQTQPFVLPSGSTVCDMANRHVNGGTAICPGCLNASVHP